MIDPSMSTGIRISRCRIGVPTVFVLGALLGACTTAAPAAPAPVSLLVVLEYNQPSLEVTSPDADLSSCFHHYAPANLTVQTSWGFAGRMGPVGGDMGHFSVLIPDVPVGIPVWVAVFDIEWCKQGRPLALVGLRANGVPLTTVIDTPEGLRALRFLVTADRRIEP